ncbi:MAG: F0F1 ATP synthase subunit A [Clostridia bacterium]|nr:F0F1 ATP synthase subunit A [Clostridia bacterium]
MQENVMQNNAEVAVKPKKVKKPWQKGRKIAAIGLIVCIILSIAVWAIDKFVLGTEKPPMGEAVAGEVFPHTVFTIFGYNVSMAVLSVWITTLVLICFAVIFRFVIFPRFKTVPTGFQAFIEWIVGAFSGMAKDNVHGYSKALGPYVFTTAAFICVGTLTEMLGTRPPNADVNVCIALAICTFILIHFYGFRHKGAKYLGKYKIIIPLVTDIAVPVSMTFRMFGSILSGFLMMALINNALAPLTPVLPAFASLLFTCFHALIQSYVFAVLSLSFVAEAIE